MLHLFLLFKCEEGAVAIEYGLIAALIAIAGIVAFTTMGTSITDIYESTQTRFCDGISTQVPGCSG